MTHEDTIYEWANDNADEVIAAVEGNGMDYPGFCVKCGAEHGGCGPDMVNGLCESCGNWSVYGAQELVFYLECAI